MSIFDKLKKIFHFQGPLINIKFINNSYNNVETKNKPIHYDANTEETLINLDEISPKQKKGIKALIDEHLNERTNKILQKETQDFFNDLHSYDKKNDSQILTFFQKIIPPSDFEALEASLYLRNVFKNQARIGNQAEREKVKKIKFDIIQAFGERGRNISNLCTSGYFEGFLKPLYNVVSKKDFNDLYEMIVGKAALALFVHEKMSSRDITSEITRKLNISIKYGIKSIHIHGIGVQNIEKIKGCLRKQEKFFNFFKQKIHEENNILIMILILK